MVELSENEKGKWFYEAHSILKNRVFTTPSEVFIIYKGIRISEDEEGFHIKNARGELDDYEDIHSHDILTLSEHGFVKGCDYLCYNRDLEEITRLESEIVRLIDKRKKFKAELPKNARLNKKRIRNINKNVRILSDEIFFRKVRSNQFKIKYKL
jgi:hypothetical protein